MPIKTLELNVADNDPVVQEVKYRANWSDAWTDATGILHAKNIVWAVNPQMPSAKLHYRWGDVQVSGSDSFNDYLSTPPVSRGDYVQIKVVGHQIDSSEPSSDTKYWHGKVINIDDHDDGRITIECSGMEQLLEETNIDSSIWAEDHDVDVDNWVVHRIANVIQFNAGNVGNRTFDVPGGELSKVFSGTRLFGDEYFWRTRDIVEYLIAYHSPKDEIGGTNVNFQLAGTNYLPDWDSPQHNPDGQTVLSFINSLVSRNRGLGYYFEVDTPDVGGGNVVMKVFTYASEKVELPIGSPAKFLEQNPLRYVLRSDLQEQGSVLVQVNNETRVDRVRCVGARSIYCFCLSVKDGNLVEKFKTDNKDLYDAGASNDAGYPAVAEIHDRQRLDQAARANPRFENVYSRLGLSVEDPTSADHWDGTTRDGEGDVTFYSAVPDADNSNNPQPLQPASIRFLSKLPLLANYKYDGSDPPELRSEQDNEYGEKYLDPMLFFERPDVPGQWIEGRSIQTLANLEFDDDQATEYDWIATFEADLNNASFKINVSGQPQHIIAPNDNSNFKAGHQASVFSPLAYEQEYLKSEWGYDKMIAIVAVEGNDFCEATVGDVSPFSDYVRTKRIDFGDRYQKHHIAADTPVAINHETGELLRRDVSGFVRDDTDQLGAIAEFAYAWYSLDRATMNLTTGHFGNFELGAMVASLQNGIAVTFDNTTNTINIPGSGADPKFVEGIGAVFYLDDAAVLPAKLSPGEIYYLYSAGGDDWTPRRRPTDPTVADFDDDGTGTAYITVSGCNTPITSIELSLPVEDDSDETDFSTTTISTGAGEYDVRNF